MTVMRKEQKEIAGLGALGTIGEAFKLLVKHSKFFFSIQLTLMLPIAVLVVIGEYFWYLTLDEYNGIMVFEWISNKTRSLSPHHGHHLIPAGMYVFEEVLPTAVMATLWTPFMSLPSAAIVYFVGRNCTGQSEGVSFTNGLRACIPSLWMRLTVTNLHKALILDYMFILGPWSFVESFAVNEWVILITLIGIVSIWMPVIMFHIEKSFRLAPGEAVLEGEYGSAAVRGNSMLLTDRIREVAAPLQLIWVESMIFISIPLSFHVIFLHLVASSEGSFPWGLCIFWGIFYTVLISFLWMMNSLVQGVQYASIKAYHGEAISESLFEKRTMKGEYELGGLEGDKLIKFLSKQCPLGDSSPIQIPDDVKTGEI